MCGDRGTRVPKGPGRHLGWPIVWFNGCAMVFLPRADGDPALLYDDTPWRVRIDEARSICAKSSSSFLHIGIVPVDVYGYRYADGRLYCLGLGALQSRRMQASPSQSVVKRPPSAPRKQVEPEVKKGLHELPPIPSFPALQPLAARTCQHDDYVNYVGERFFVDDKVTDRGQIGE